MNDNTYEFIYHRSEEKFTINAWVFWDKDRPIIYDDKKDGTDGLTMTFDRMNHGLWLYVERNIIKVEKSDNDKEPTMTYDFLKLKTFIIRYLLKEWNLPLKLEFNSSGAMTDGCFERVMSVHPNIMRYFVDIVESKLFMSEEEKSEISKQSAVLFHPKSKGVNNPSEAISMYCLLTSFWEKFGLNYFEIQRLPYDTYMRMRAVMNHEVNFKNQEMMKMHNSANNAKRGRR